MISGIFAAVFASTLGSGGTGVAVLSGNAIHGGDMSFYFRGKYRLEDGGRIFGTIDVKRYSPLQTSIFGPGVDSFRLTLKGSVVKRDEGFELSGEVDGQPGLGIKILLNKIDDLIEA